MTASLKSRFRYHTRPGKWKFVLAGELVCHLGIPLRGSHLFIDKGFTIARLDGAGWSRAQADSIFRDLLRARGFPLAEVYFFGVTLFGGIHRALRRPSTTIACITHH